MKRVLLLRHAKSKRGPGYEIDFERPLAGRGKRDAVRMGEFIAENGLVPDLILSSPAERARQTALRCAEAAGYEWDVRMEQSLYLESEEAYLELLANLDDTVRTVLFVGHNPDIAEAVQALSGEWTRMPTAALACVEFDVESWADLVPGEGSLSWVQLARQV